MMFKQFYLESLGHASYLIGSEEIGEALVLEPRRDVDVYFQNARQEGVLIAFAVDTHQHNDYLSGARELSHRGGVEILASASAQLGYPARPLKEGERLGAIHISGGELPDRIGEVPRDRPVAVICGSGYRSSVVSSHLKRAGREEIFNVLGGMGAWKRAGLPTESSSNIREGGA